jgi:hypothetical protein
MSAVQGFETVGLDSQTYVNQGLITINTDAAGITKTATLEGDSIQVDGTISATGNITGSYFLGNGSQLTGLTSFVGATGPQGPTGATGPSGSGGGGLEAILMLGGM